MTQASLHVTLTLPFRQTPHVPSPADHGLWQQAALVMRVFNEMEIPLLHDSESQPVLHRLEAKIDLTLSLLAQALRGGHPLPAEAGITLWPDGLSWAPAAPLKPGDCVLATLYLSTSLPLPVHLPVQVTESSPTQTRGHWIAATENGLEFWEQWLFRQHRRAIHAAREHD